jgi:hypothetical protein
MLLALFAAAIIATTIAIIIGANSTSEILGIDKTTERATDKVD